MQRSLCALLGLLASCESGCAASLSSFRPAHVGQPAEVQVESGIDIAYPTGSIADVIDAAEVVEELNTQRLLTPEESTAIVKAAGALGLNSPALIPHLGVAVGALENWEVGARLATSGWRFTVRRQLVSQAQSDIDISLLGAGFGTSIFTPPIERASSALSEAVARYGSPTNKAMAKTRRRCQ